MDEGDHLAHLLAQAKQAEVDLATLETQVRIARERVRQARARYAEAADRFQLSLPYEEEGP